MPSYKFYRKSVGGKIDESLERKVNNLEKEYRLLQLHSVIISPFDERFNLRIEIDIEGEPKISILMSNLQSAAANVNQLFFADGITSKFRSVLMPGRAKNITYKVIPLPTAKDFELTLSCDYAISVSKEVR